MSYSLLDLMRGSARANRLANQRLHAAMAPLSATELQAPRTSYFPSLAATLNHILLVDLYYIAALHREADMARRAEEFQPEAELAALAARQAASDERLIRWCDAADAAGLDAEIALDRGDRIDVNTASQTLAHLFMHQTHHRGQVHAMLAGTAIEPPQLDEFLLASDARFRVDDLSRLGWTEAALFPSPADRA